MTARHTHTNATPVSLGRRRCKRSAGALEIAALATLAILLVAAACSGTNPRNVAQTTHHRVAAGETLWSLAQGVRAPGQTTEEAVQVIAELNGIDHSSLQVGATLKLPAKDSISTAQAMR